MCAIWCVWFVSICWQVRSICVCRICTHTRTHSHNVMCMIPTHQVGCAIGRGSLPGMTPHTHKGRVCALWNYGFELCQTARSSDTIVSVLYVQFVHGLQLTALTLTHTLTHSHTHTLTHPVCWFRCRHRLKVVHRSAPAKAIESKRESTCLCVKGVCVCVKVRVCVCV